MSEAKIKIRLNGEESEVPVGLTIEGLLLHLEIGQKRVAVAQNGQVIPKSVHADTVVNESDQVEIVRMVGGG